MKPPVGNDFLLVSGGIDYALALIPEPSTLFLLGLGAVMLRRKR
ncbi:MAG: PEP-CTERM sorting domain-containing protein [Sedimentisphaerales bacterium]|nr:PEP-CTERM sorting domain-containing protein [Sedimentisphaerales bacterium]